MMLRLHFLMALGALWAAPVLANPDPVSQICDQAAVMAAEQYDIPAKIMLAITRVETGRLQNGVQVPWPWTVNLAGEGHWFETKDAAVEFVEQALADGMTNADIGCFQLNLRWHAENFASVSEMFDPKENANYAAEFLVRKYLEKGNWVDGVAAYHSETLEHAEKYIERVEAALTAITDPAEVATPLPVAVRANRFPLLQPGARGSIGSLVPLVGDVQPLFSAGN